jgi:hypothetical protein
VPRPRTLTRGTPGTGKATNPWWNAIDLHQVLRHAPTPPGRKPVRRPDDPGAIQARRSK